MRAMKEGKWKVDEDKVLQRLQIMVLFKSSVALAAVLAASINVDAFTVAPSTTARSHATITALQQHIGAGGMADTRDPASYVDEDPRKSISAAPSFEEYLKQRDGGGAAAAATTDAAVDKVAADMLDSSREAATSASSSSFSIGGDFDAESAISALESSQSKLVANIASSIPDLALKPDASICPSSSDFTISGHAVKLDASDAPGPANVAWLSDLCIDDTLSSLTIFNGPLTDVPHLISRCAVTNDGSSLDFFLDFRPRSYGAYDLRDAEGRSAQLYVHYLWKNKCSHLVYQSNLYTHLIRHETSTIIQLLCYRYTIPDRYLM